MTLDEWLESQPDMTQSAFGRRVGANHSTVSRWRSGKLLPSWPQMLAILRATGGQVTPNDFIPADAMDQARAAPITDVRQAALPFEAAA